MLRLQVTEGNFSLQNKLVQFRFNSTYLMLARILRIKGCVASALLNFEKTDIEFTSRNFELLRMVTKIL